MGRAPCCDKASVKKGPWSPEEDAQLKEYIDKYGTGGNWIALPQKAGLKRCGKSCRLRWLNYLRPNIKHGDFSDVEDRIICTLFASIGSRWSIIAAQLPGRTDNDIKNYWNTKLKKKLTRLVPLSQRRPHLAITHAPISVFQTSTPSLHSSPTLPSTSSEFKCTNNNYHITTARSFTGYELAPIPSSHLNSTSSNSGASAVLQVEDGYMGSMNDYQVKDSLPMFGGDQGSCSSSDGSFSNLISQGREVEYEFGVSNGGGHMGLQGYIYNGVEENPKLLSNCGGVNGYVVEKASGLYGETPLDYSLEEINQLISSNISNNLNFFVDGNKAEEKIMYY
ncbi:unnamed protein product [Ilex paraguariensis]|uniref:Uncharacterized protein n=1 Tax=Ilex paraguariensis TaxID=185542 RepID=A0ABC8SUC5_9AQUA